MDDLPQPSELSRNYSGSSQIFTPKPLVRAILNGIDFLLKKTFTIRDGLLALNLSFLDPAAGCLAFPLGLLDFIVEKVDKSDLTVWIQNIFLQKVFLFEIDPQICQQCHKIIHSELNKWNSSELYSPLQRVDFSNLFCLNTLSTPNAKDPVIQIRDNIPDIKNDLLIVLGNPPYQASGKKTDSPWISKLIEEYKQNLTQKGDKKIKGLKGIQDDYVKFLRFAQWKLHDQDHPGLMAYVVNNFFLDGLIFRGLRINFVETFDEIWIINLHGDPKKKGHQSNVVNLRIKDENVFDIQTGICLFFAVKSKKTQLQKKTFSTTSNLAHVFYTEVYGDKMTKFSFVSQPFSTFSFQSVSLNEQCSFIPKSQEDQIIDSDYQSFPSMTEIFLKNMVGAQSLHDTLVTHPDKRQLAKHLTHFYSGDYKSYEIVDSKGQRWVKCDGVEFHDARDWKIDDALQQSLPNALNHLVLWQWRGFDQWWVAYDPFLMTRGTMGYSLLQFLFPSQHNRAIGTARVSRKANGGTSVLMINTIAESHFIEGGSGIGDYVFPLRINRNVKKGDYSQIIPATDSNINPEFRNQIPYASQISDEEIFYYCYAVLYTPKFRELFCVSLKNNFPRIPFPIHIEHFKPLAALGLTLAEIHLLNVPQTELASWPMSTSDDYAIRNPVFDPKSQRIFFDQNEEKFWIGNISQEMWDFEIGGIPQLSNWLKSRTITRSTLKYRFNRPISKDELYVFISICIAIQKTLKLLSELNHSYHDIRNLFLRTSH